MTYDPFDPFSEAPMYTDYFLRFDTEAEANAALYDEQTNVQGDIVETVLVPKYAAVDIIGTIFKPTGKTLKTPEGPVPEMKAVPGWHVNVRHTETAPELDAYKVEVKTPSRMWA
jgi:hypothetical protein